MNFPSHFVNPKDKNREWYLNMAKAAIEEWEHLSSSDSFLRGAGRYGLNRRYSIGRQPTNQHLEIAQTDDDSGENESYMNIDFSPLAIIPKIRRAALGRLSKVPDEIHVDAIDPLAQLEKQDYEKKERANIKVREAAQQLGADTSVLDSGEIDQPKTAEELAMKMEFSYQHNMAIDTEKRIETVFTANRIEQLRGRIRWDLFDYGVAGYRDWTEPDGSVKMRIIHPDRLIVSPTEDPFFGDIWYVGEVKFMTISEIRTIAGDSITDDQYEEIEEKYKSNMGQRDGLDTQLLKGQDGFMIPVMELEFVTVDEQVYESRINKRGNKITGKVDHKYKNAKRKGRTYHTDANETVCVVNLVLDTDVIFDYGPAYDQTQKPGSSWYAKPSFHVCAPELWQMNTVAIVDHVKPIVEMVQGAWQKLQNTIAQARPKGIAIEMGSMESISLGKGDEDMTPLDLMDLFNQTGNIVYRSIDPQTGVQSLAKPIEELQNGLGSDAREYFDIIQGTMAWLGSIVGLNDFTDGSTPDPRSLNGVASVAIEGTQNALKFLADAERDLLERVAESVAIRVHDSIHFKGSKVYANTLGTNGMKSLDQRKQEVFREYGLKVVDRGDQFERERLATRIEKSLDKDEITLADATAIENVTNLKQQEVMLSYRIKVNQERLAAEAQGQIEANSNAQIQAAEAAEAAKHATIEAQKAADIAVVSATEDAKRKTIEFEHPFLMEQIAATSGGKLDVQVEANEGGLDKQEITNEGLLAVEKAKPKPVKPTAVKK